ncbi:MAG TPA: hypothetical protein VND64_19480 [Pirellulales bacterium]|nr:hypothetical protein [Pirellulales bacterium]
MTTFDVLSGRLTLDTSPWLNALRQAQGALAQFVANMVRAMDVLKVGTSNVATALGAMTPALAGLAATGVKVEQSFEQSLAKLRGITQTAAVDLNTLGKDTSRWEPIAPPAVDQAAADGVAGAGAGVGSRPAQLAQLPRSDVGGAAAEPMSTLRAYGEALLAQFERNAELLGQDRETSLKNSRDAQVAVEALAATVKLSDEDLEAFGKNAGEAAAQAKELGNDMAALDAVQKKNAFHAAGMAAPQEQSAHIAQHGFMRQAMNQAMNQFAQMAQGAAMKIAMGPSDLNALIDQAKAKGDPLGALDLITQNARMKAGQSNFNLHQLAGTVGSLGSTGDAFPGVDNSAYLKSTGDPAAVAAQQFADLLARLQQQRAALVKQLGRGKPAAPGVGSIAHMATGGITVGPMTALIGEDGPEAVIPLTSLWNQLQQTLKQNLGGTLASFTNNFSKWSQTINQQMNVGNFANSGFLQNMASQNMAMVGALHQYQEHSQIDLQPVRGTHVRGGTNLMGSPRSGLGGVFTGDTSDQYAGPNVTHNITVNVHGADLTTPAGARQVASLLVPHIDAVARKMGTDMTGTSAMRSPAQPFNAAPTAYAR